MVCSFVFGKELSSMAASNYTASVVAGGGRGELGFLLGEEGDEGS